MRILTINAEDWYNGYISLRTESGGDLTIVVAKHAKGTGVKQFIYMSSQIVFHQSQSLKTDMLTKKTKEQPNGFYGDSKLQAEKGLKQLCGPMFKICILRPPMIYGPNSRGNFLRLGWLATKTSVFLCWHNKRSMLYIDNLGEFVKQAILRELEGTFYPQNRELAEWLRDFKDAKCVYIYDKEDRGPWDEVIKNFENFK